MFVRKAQIQNILVAAVCIAVATILIITWQASKKDDIVWKDKVRNDLLQLNQQLQRELRQAESSSLQQGLSPPQHNDDIVPRKPEEDLKPANPPDTQSLPLQNADNTDESNSTIDLYKAYEHVKTLLLFIGYSRSRHSLVSSLLDAHPHMIIADESYSLSRWMNQAKWKQGTKEAFYDSLLGSSIRAVKNGRRSHELKGSAVDPKLFGYAIPEQWQATYDRYIEIIGDKTAWDTSSTLLNRGTVGIQEMKDKFGVKVKFLHVVRNPFDNIATFVLRHRDIQQRQGNHEAKVVNASDILDGKIDLYFRWAKGSDVAEQAFPDDTLDVISMDVVKKPAETLRKMCDFLEISCSEKYIQDCAAIVDPVPSITRHHIVWTEEQKQRVYTMMKQYKFFDSFTFDDE